jgi:cytochrome c1
MRRTRLFSAALSVGLLGALLPGTVSALDLGPSAVEAGRRLFESNCRVCHAMRYLGYAATMPAEAAKSAFGREPPDLSLIAAARGRGTSGAEHIVRLLTSYDDTPERNSVFPGIDMPPPIPRDDPALQEKARQVAAFLHQAAFPELPVRRTVGAYVLAYTALLTLLLYLLYRSIWKGVPHSLT